MAHNEATSSIRFERHHQFDEAMQVLVERGHHILVQRMILFLEQRQFHDAKRLLNEDEHGGGGGGGGGWAETPALHELHARLADTARTLVDVGYSERDTFHAVFPHTVFNFASETAGLRGDDGEPEHHSSYGNGGSGAVPAPAAAVDGLEKRTFHAGEVIGSGVTECSICFEDFVDGGEVSVMPCPSLRVHQFHPDCIAMWLGISNMLEEVRYRMYGPVRLTWPSAPSPTSGSVVAIATIPSATSHRQEHRGRKIVREKEGRNRTRWPAALVGDGMEGLGGARPSLIADFFYLARSSALANELKCMLRLGLFGNQAKLSNGRKTRNPLLYSGQPVLPPPLPHSEGRRPPPDLTSGEGGGRAADSPGGISRRRRCHVGDVAAEDRGRGGHVGRQVWEFDAAAEPDPAVDAARRAFVERRHDLKHSADLLMRIQVN
ncbi:hypothetical protein HU200_054417 [Digitaria exilis]|uniref:RING-type domain-containing protein n=1 Tax=Digitaria exilis TaxID=1010633 RepID=A0A835AKI1_9POAL|nr:hypothetical protein HU200_054417 [Digitaria exilis]